MIDGTVGIRDQFEKPKAYVENDGLMENHACSGWNIAGSMIAKCLEILLWPSFDASIFVLGVGMFTLDVIIRVGKETKRVYTINPNANTDNTVLQMQTLYRLLSNLLQRRSVSPPTTNVSTNVSIQAV